MSEYAPDPKVPNGQFSPGLPPGEIMYPQLELNQLIEANKAGFAAMARMGVNADPVSQLGMQCAFLSLRIDVLAELAFGNGPGMLQFRLRFERKVAEALEEMRGQVRKAQLASAAQASPQQVKQMAAEQGLLGPDGNPVRR